MQSFPQKQTMANRMIVDLRRIVPLVPLCTTRKHTLFQMLMKKNFCLTNEKNFELKYLNFPKTFPIKV